MSKNCKLKLTAVFLVGAGKALETETSAIPTGEAMQANDKTNRSIIASLTELSYIFTVEAGFQPGIDTVYVEFDEIFCSFYGG